MVAALKRLLIGHMMNLDPDIPALDASFSFLMDRELQADPEYYGDGHLAPKQAPENGDFGGSDIDHDYAPTTGQGLRYKQALGEFSHVPSTNTDQGAEGVLWVPANVHPEVNPQQFKNHVRTTMDELLERKLSRLKSARSAKRSSLSLSTTDGFHMDDQNDENSPPPVQPIDPKESKESIETQENEDRRRLSNPSLRRLTSELQTMSRLAGMDSSDAVTLARSLSTSSLGYSDVERTAIDGLEHVGTGAGVGAGMGVADPNNPSDVGRNGHYMRQYPGHSPGNSPKYLPRGYLPNSGGISPVSGTSSGSGGHMSPHSSSQHGFQHGGPHGKTHEDFLLRRSRRVDYRKSPTVSLLGSQLQNNKAGKLAQLRHNLLSSNLQSASPELGLDRLVGKQASGKLRAPYPGVNPRSSQVLFSYKSPTQQQQQQQQQQQSNGPNKSLTAKSAPPPQQSPGPGLVPGPGAAVPLVGVSPRDSPYLTAIASDPLARNLHPTKYAHHNLTSKTLAHLGTPPQSPTLNKHDMGSVPRTGYRVSSREHDSMGHPVGHPHPQGQPQGQSHPGHHDLRELPRKSRGPHGGHRHVSPTSPLVQPSTPRVSSRESPVQNQGAWVDLLGRKRYVSPNSMSAGAGAGAAPPHPQTQRLVSGEALKGRPFSKRDKTRELNQNLDLLRNEINEFKESLSAKGDPNQKMSSPESLQKQSEEPSDFSFDLTHQDVSYEESLDIETDVLKDLEAIADQVKAQLSPEPGPTAAALEEAQDDEIVSIPESAGVKSSTFRNTVAQDTTHILKAEPKSEVAYKAKVEHKPKVEHKRYVEPKPEVEVIEHVPEKTKREEPLPLSPTIDRGSEKVVNQGKRDDPVREVARENIDVGSRNVANQGAVHAKKARDRRPNAHQSLDERQHVPESSHHDAKERKGPQPTRRQVLSASVQEEEVAQRSEVSRQNTMESTDSSEKQSIRLSLDSTGAKTKSSEKKKSKKPWPWSKDKSASVSEEKTTTKEVRSPVRSVSSPEMAGFKRDAPLVKEEQSTKENAITKFFKKRRSNSVSHEKLNSDHFLARNSTESSESEIELQSVGRSKGQRHSKSSDKYAFDDALSQESKDAGRDKSNDESKLADDQRVTSRLKTRIKNMKKIHEEKEEKPVTPAASPSPQVEENVEDDSKPKSTLEVQEKLKKAIKRYSRPNQPIEFTDSAFGFPLPPPSSSTLVMIDYRFPVHVERAIYRLSHLKLANPKRSLREQVILSNFMYAYLNLVDHTLHLEQQMTLEEYEVEQPEADLDFMGDQDVDTEFEADDGFEESDFDSIKIDLDVKGNPGMV